MRFLFLNQYFPPDPAPTGELLQELADDLAARGHTVSFVAARQEYRASQHRAGRMRREMAALLRMLWDGLRQPKADVVISASSPPCLLPVAALIARRHRAEHFHWIMDLYPEIATALGEVRPGMMPWAIGRAMGWGYRHARRVVALDEDMAGRVRGYGIQPTIIRPWVLARIPVQPAPILAGAEPWTWIYSGNLGRAHEWETLLRAQAIVEARDPEIRLRMQGGGPAWPAAQARAAGLGLRHCVWEPYVEERELPQTLLRAEVCVVTQKPEARGCLWPSKLALLLALPRPILWIGPTEGAIARELRDREGSGIFAPGDAEGVAEWLLAQRNGASSRGAVLAMDPAAHRSRALADWRQVLGLEP